VDLEVLRHAPVEARHFADRELAVARARHALEVALAQQPLLQFVELAHLRANRPPRIAQRKRLSDRGRICYRVFSPHSSVVFVFIHFSSSSCVTGANAMHAIDSRDV
jgi:hypothetical protein